MMMINTYTIDEKMMDVGCGISEQLSYMRKKNMPEKVLKTTVTVLDVCYYPF